MNTLYIKKNGVRFMERRVSGYASKNDEELYPFVGKGTRPGESRENPALTTADPSRADHQRRRPPPAAQRQSRPPPTGPDRLR